MRRPVALAWNATAAAAPLASSASASSSPYSAAAAAASLSSSQTQRRARRGARTVMASSAVASPPPPAASSSGTMGGGGGGGDLGEVTAVRFLVFFESESTFFFFWSPSLERFRSVERKEMKRSGAFRRFFGPVSQSPEEASEHLLPRQGHAGAFDEITQTSLSLVVGKQSSPPLVSLVVVALFSRAVENASPFLSPSSFVSFSLAPPLQPKKTTKQQNETTQQIHGPEELDATLAANPTRLVVLMAKSAGCRPCKAFARKYQRIAALYPDAVFTVVTGDESKETRAMMMAMKVSLEREGGGERERRSFFSFLLLSWKELVLTFPSDQKKKQVRVTPTFFVYRDRALFKTTTGVNENNLKAALDEAGGGNGAGAAAAAEEAAAA